MGMQSRVDGPVRPQRRPLVQSAFGFMASSSGSGEPFPVEQIDAETLAGAVARWTSQGYAISFGLSQDLAVFAVHLLVGGDKRTKWCKDVPEAEDFLASVPPAPRP